MDYSVNKITFRCLAVAVLCLVIASCGGGKGQRSSSVDIDKPISFPDMPSAPKTYTEQVDIAKYVANHFWNKFFAEYMSFPTDSTKLCGVANEDIELAVGTFATILENNLPLKDGQQAMKIFFDLLESQEAEDPSSEVFERLVEVTNRYFYDPNSPVRNEDLYLPFVTRLSKSKVTNPDMIPAYQYDASMCALNQVGTPAADFSFTDLSGKVSSLYSVKAEYTLLFFSNPGCPSCKEIMDALDSDLRIEASLASGKLKIVNIYIDQELDYWRDYAKTYPKTWISGYDHKYKIRTNSSYNVRAIPSLYILDADKNVIMKDAPQNAALSYLRNI